MFLFVFHNVNCLLGEIPCHGMVVITLNLIRKSQANFQTEKVADKTCYDSKNTCKHISIYDIHVLSAIRRGCSHFNTTQTC